MTREETPKGEPATVLVASSTDLASKTLASALINGHGFQSTGVNLLGKPVYQKDSMLLFLFDGLIVDPPELDSYFNPQAYVFLSRHSAESGVASLTAHTTGNFSLEAKFGGNGRELSRVDPDLLKNYLMSLSSMKERVGDYRITVEATHHGPTSLAKPVLFVELGSSERSWGDTRAALVVANALVDSLRGRKSWQKVGIGFGGTHYPDRFNGVLLESEFAISFVVPKYSLEWVDEGMLGQMLQKTSGVATRYALLDWKGLGEHKSRISTLVEQFGLEAVRV